MRTTKAHTVSDSDYRFCCVTCEAWMTHRDYDYVDVVRGFTLLVSERIHKFHSKFTKGLSIIKYRWSLNLVIGNLWPSLAHLSHWLMVSYCDHWMCVLCRPSSTISSRDIYLLLSPPKTTRWILTKLGRNDPYTCNYKSYTAGN